LRDGANRERERESRITSNFFVRVFALFYESVVFGQRFFVFQKSMSFKKILVIVAFVFVVFSAPSAYAIMYSTILRKRFFWTALFCISKIHVI